MIKVLVVISLFFSFPNSFTCLAALEAFSKKFSPPSSRDLLLNISYNIQLQTNGKYTSKIDNLYFRENSPLDVFKNYFWDEGRAKKSFVGTETKLDFLKVGLDKNQLQSCASGNKPFLIKSKSSKTIGTFYKKSATLSFNCRLYLDPKDNNTCVQNCVLISDASSQEFFQMNNPKSLPTQEIRCKHETNEKYKSMSSFINCQVQTSGISKEIAGGFGLYRSSPVKNSLGGVIVALRSNVNLSLVSHGSLNEISASDYLTKIDFWKTVSKQLDQLPNDSIYVYSRPMRTYFVIR